MWRLMGDPWLWLALAMLISSAFLWYFAVSRISLGVAFAFAALSYPMVLIGSQMFLGESFVVQQYLGCVLIVGGIFMRAAYA